jgi:hypothetical protein
MELGRFHRDQIVHTTVFALRVRAHVTLSCASLNKSCRPLHYQSKATHVTIACSSHKAVVPVRVIADIVMIGQTPIYSTHKNIVRRRLTFVLFVMCELIHDRQLTLATDATVVDASLTQFAVVKGISSSPMCVIDTQPLFTVVAESAESCSSHCQRWRRISACDGFNRRDDSKTCEFFASNQTKLGFISSCRYFTVGIVHVIVTF